ncbi:MAG: thioredoxin family protein [Bacteroidetes bacterium]|nr:thioredoxin family protein [Bacteroidota bacterium]HET6244301.1 thioredoxin fold domain-containing protein [Bacteroidia bacterium]
MKTFIQILLCFFLISSIALAQKTKDVASKTEAKGKETVAKTITWMSFDEAFAANKKNPKKIMIDVYTDWCGPCKMMMANTFTNAVIIDYINKNYYAVKFNAESGEPVNFKDKTYTNPGFDPTRGGRNATHELTQVIAPVNGKIAYPTIVYMDENMNILTPVQGYYQPEQIEPILKFFGGNVYQKETFEEFQKSFVSEFKK